MACSAVGPCQSPRNPAKFKGAGPRRGCAQRFTDRVKGSSGLTARLLRRGSGPVLARPGADRRASALRTSAAAAPACPSRTPDHQHLGRDAASPRRASPRWRSTMRRALHLARPGLDRRPRRPCAPASASRSSSAARRSRSRSVPHAGRLVDAEPTADELRPPALQEAQIGRVVDDAGEVGVLVVDAEGEAVGEAQRSSIWLSMSMRPSMHAEDHDRSSAAKTVGSP